MSSILSRILIDSGHSIFSLIGCVRAQLQYFVHVSQLEGSSKSILAPKFRLFLWNSAPSHTILLKRYVSVLYNLTKRIHFGPFNLLLRRDLVLRSQHNSCPFEENSYSISGVVSLPSSVLSLQDGLLTLVKVS